LLIGLLVLTAVLVCATVALLSRSGAQKAPEKPDFGTVAAAWQKNEKGYYFDSDGEPMPGAVLKGIDVSKYQGEVDWQKAMDAGIDFAILRCGYGGEWDGQAADWNQDDPYWRRNADECTRLGIPFGVYLYSYATNEEEARSEADHVARLLGLTPPPYAGLEDYTAAPYSLSFPVYYDLEDKSITGLFPDEMANITAAFFARLEEHGYTGEQGLYASLNWVRARFSDPGFDRWRDNLWIARFAPELGYTHTYDMWQCSYTEPGEAYGVQSETVDIDFVMRDFAITGIENRLAKSVQPVYSNDTKTKQLWLAEKSDRAVLTTNYVPLPDPETEDGKKAKKKGPDLFYESSDPSVATVDKNGEVVAVAQGSCTVTVTLADGTEQDSVTVRVGTITVPVFATGALRGERENDTVSLAEVAALKAGDPDAILLDAGGSLQGTAAASMTGGMDMTSAFSSAGYDLQAIGAQDLAYGLSRLLSDANTAAGPCLASNLRQENGTPLFYRSTSWNRNRITNGMNYIIERAGQKIGFFALTDAAAVNGRAAVVNEAAPTAGDLAQTAAEQVAALQAQGAQAILCIATPGVDTASLADTLADLGVTAVIDAGLEPGSTLAGKLPVAAAATGLNGVCRLDLQFTPGEAATASVEAFVTAEDLAANRENWQSSGDPAWLRARSGLDELKTGDGSIAATPLFTFGLEDGVEKTVSWANYLAELYETTAQNDKARWPADTETLSLCAAAGGVSEMITGEITRGNLLESLPQAARLQLVRADGQSVKRLMDSGQVTRTYLKSLTEYQAAEGDVLLVTDTATLALLDTEYTVLRDYGDLFWLVRMHINDVTNNFTTVFTLPKAPALGAGRGTGH